jgi:hypothetical protein
VKSKQKRRNPNRIPGNPNNKKTDFLFEFHHNLLFGFPGFSKESGKSKLKNSKIQTIMRKNLNKKAVFLIFGFRRFCVWVSRILVWISLIN